MHQARLYLFPLLFPVAATAQVRAGAVALPADGEVWVRNTAPEAWYFDAQAADALVVQAIGIDTRRVSPVGLIQR